MKTQQIWQRNLTNTSHTKHQTDHKESVAVNAIESREPAQIDSSISALTGAVKGDDSERSIQFQ